MGTHPIFESDFDCLTDMGHKVWHSSVDDGGNQYRWFLKDYKPPTKWPDAIDTTKNINNAKDWFPYGMPWAHDIWNIWGREGLVKRPVKVDRQTRRAAKLNVFMKQPPDHCMEFYMNLAKCNRDKTQQHGPQMVIIGKPGFGFRDCEMYAKQCGDCVVQEHIIGMGLHERVKRIQNNMNIDYMPRGWF